MNRHLPLALAAVVLSLSLGGCATSTYSLEAEAPEGVTVLKGGESGNSVVLSDRSGSSLMLEPKKEQGLNNHSELWFNLVAVNKDAAPVDFSISNVRATVNGEPATIPNVDELERLMKVANNKARALAWGTLLLGAATVATSGGDASLYTAQMMPAYLKAESVGSETTQKMLSQYKDTVLKPQTIASLENHGGLIRIIPTTPIGEFSTIDLRFDIGAEEHIVKYRVQTEAKKN